MTLPKVNTSFSTSINPESLATLMSMGFSDIRCAQALKEANSNVEMALNILFSKASDPNYGMKPVTTKSKKII